MTASVGPVAVVCSARRAPALPALAARLDVCAVVLHGRRTALPPGLPICPNVAAALDDGAQRVVILSPYTRLVDEVGHCRERQVDVVTAGPLPDGDASTWTPGRACWQPGIVRARELAATAGDQLGRPVYLRWVGEGEGALGAWWTLLEGLDLARSLLDDEVDGGWLTAHRAGRRWHATACLRTMAGATVQLLATPAAVAGDEWMWLTSGGLIWTEGARDASLLHDAEGVPRLRPAAATWPDGPWAEAALAQGQAQRPGTSGAAAKAWLQALRQAADRHRPVPIPPLPATLQPAGRGRS